MAQKSTKQAVTTPTPPKSQIAKQKNAIAFPWLVLAGILFLTLLVYLPSNDNQFTNWDDDVYVTENSLITKPQDFQAILR